MRRSGAVEDGVLVQRVCGAGGHWLKACAALAVADLVVRISRVPLCGDFQAVGRADHFTASVVAEVVGTRRVDGTAGLRAISAAAEGVIRVGVLGDAGSRDFVIDARHDVAIRFVRIGHSVLRCAQAGKQIGVVFVAVGEGIGTVGDGR